MLRYDPVPWLVNQEGLPALRARRLLALCRPGDGFDLPLASEIIRSTPAGLVARHQRNGAFGAPCSGERVAAVLLAVRAVTQIGGHACGRS